MRRAHLPARNDFLLYAFYTVILAAFFFTVYSFTNEYGAEYHMPFKFYSRWELNIPFIPEMIFVYMSLNLLTGMTFFYLNRQEIHAIAATFAVATVIGAAFFILLPTELGFLRIGETSSLGPIYSKLYELDRPHNLFPSMHVAFATIATFALVKIVGPRMRAFLILWFLTMCASVVLTHQHHIADIGGGYLLGQLCIDFIYTKIARRAT
jgi:membrane-associated phospholipid phosphatase